MDGLIISLPAHVHQRFLWEGEQFRHLIDVPSLTQLLDI